MAIPMSYMKADRRYSSALGVGENDGVSCTRSCLSYKKKTGRFNFFRSVCACRRM